MASYHDRLEQAALAVRLADNLTGIYADMRAELSDVLSDPNHVSDVQRIRNDGAAFEIRLGWHQSFDQGHITGLINRMGLNPNDLGSIEDELGALIVRWKNFEAVDNIALVIAAGELLVDTPVVRRFLV